MTSSEILLLALATVFIGSGDLFGGIASRRSTPVSVAAWSQLIGIPVVLVVAVVVGGQPTTSDLLFGAVAGLGSGLGVGALYRGFSRSSVGIVAPTASTIATMIPIAVGLLSGERPTLLVALGLVVALPAIVLIGWSRDTHDHVRAGLGHGVVSGVGFGLMVVAYSMTDPASGVWSVVAGRISASTVLVLVIVLFGAGFAVERDARSSTVLAGILPSVGLAAFVSAAQTASLLILGVALAMMPTMTVVLAVIFLKERLATTQWFGIATAALAIALISVG
ncbi:MAG: DMT family transporter [Actinomycetota bacterium]